MDDRVLSALSYLDPSCRHEEWVEIGMALKHEGYPCDVWDQWSSGSYKYKAGICEKKWASFKGSSKPVTCASIISRAKENGWHPWGGADGIMDWNDTISYDGEGCTIVYQNEPYHELRTYLTTLFESEDHIGYCTSDCFQDEDGKWKPKAGSYRKTLTELLAALDKHPEDVGYTIGDWEKDAGAWIRFNPLDGNGIKDDNVTDFRYALVESDDMPKAEQENIYRKLELPIACMVDSAGKSVHAIVRIGAANRDEYRDRVDYLYNVLSANGLKVDRQNRNASRYSRMPGVTRKGIVQHLIATNIGKRSFDEWKASIEHKDDLPPFKLLSDLIAENKPLAPELIHGVVRCGHKMIVVGDSKSGKSFMMVELCVAIATGGEWLGYKCKQGKVLYVNLEIDEASVRQRFADCCKAMGAEPDTDRISVWNLRGQAQPMNILSDIMINRIKNGDYDAIIIDPIYKVITGDENNASDMGAFCNQFDRVCQGTGATVIYCHHHSKGAQGAKKAMDRASGSGVFARDADAMLDITLLDIPDEVMTQILPCDGAKPFRIETTLREFADSKPKDMWFIYPIHTVDKNGDLSKFHPAGSPLANLDKCPNRLNKLTQESFDNAVEMCTPDPFKRVNDVAEYLGITRQTVYKKAEEFGYRIDNGLLIKEL